jgi:hypothetical protein
MSLPAEDAPSVWWAWTRANRRARWVWITKGATFGETWSALLVRASTIGPGSRRLVLPAGAHPERARPSAGSGGPVAGRSDGEAAPGRLQALARRSTDWEPTRGEGGNPSERRDQPKARG